MKPYDVDVKNILLAVDGSDHSLAATQLIGALPLSSETQITAVSVLIPRHAQLTTSLEGVIMRTESILASSQAKLHSKIIGGEPAEVLSRLMDEAQYDLTVLGAKGLRNTLGIFLGGVAQSVVEYANCPVLVVRAPYSELRRVLLIVDGSEHGRLATQYLNQIPLAKGIDLFLMHVLPPPIEYESLIYGWPTGMDIAPPIPTEEFKTRLEEQAASEHSRGEALLEDAASMITSSRFKMTKILQEGDAATQILEVSQ